jgi:chymotrypsin
VSAFSQKIVNKNHLVVHSFYNPKSLLNDIALIFLQSASADLLNHPNIATISLPISSDADVDLVGMLATVSGFGSISDTNKASDKLRFVTMPIISNLQCRRVFGTYIQPSNLCMSGQGGKSVCSGDSGGPMTVEIAEKRSVIVGIVSFGHKHSCTLGHPGVFVRVTSYLSWIESYVGNMPRDTEDGIVVNRAGYLSCTSWIIVILNFFIFNVLLDFEIRL